MLAFLATLCFQCEVKAQFPLDLLYKPLIINRIEHNEVTVFKDSGLTEKADTISGYGLKIKAIRLKDGAVYGSYKEEKKKTYGWFSSEIYQEQDFKTEYRVACHEIPVYADESYDQVIGTTVAYSDLVVVGGYKEHYKVIFDQGEEYRIGWIDEEGYTSTRPYDHTEKRVLAGGRYHMYCIGENDLLEEEEPEGMDVEMIPADTGTYYIKNLADDHYITVLGTEFGFEGSLSRSPEEDEKNGTFVITKCGNDFSIQSTRNLMYLNVDAQGKLTLCRGRAKNGIWKIKAIERVVDPKHPFVFTQYDPQWGGIPYGGGTCMAASACGVLAPVNAVYALTGEYMNVMELADYAVEKEYRIIGSGTDNGLFKAAAKKFGKKYNFRFDGSSASLDVIKKKLQKGETGVAHVQGHYVALVAYSKKKNKYLLLDPCYLPKRETGAFGDWVEPERLESGALNIQSVYFYKLRETDDRSAEQ